MVHYGAARGPILASGLAFQAVFAGFAAMWVGFSVAGLVVAGDVVLRQAIIDFIAENVPGLIDDGSGRGAVDPSMLLDAGVFGWTGVLALLGLIVTALGWLASARDAVRSVFGLPAPPVNFFLLRLRDLGLALTFGLAILTSALLSLAGTQATGWALDLFGVDEEAPIAYILGRVVTLSVMFALDSVVLGLLFRVLSGVKIPWAHLRVGVLLGAAGLAALKILGGSLLGAASNNPLLASFAVIIGLLIWFNLMCQVMLVSAAWIYVEMMDVGVAVDPDAEVKRLEEQRRLLEARKAAENALRRRGLARIFRRRRSG